MCGIRLGSTASKRRSAPGAAARAVAGAGAGAAIADRRMRIRIARSCQVQAQGGLRRRATITAAAPGRALSAVATTGPATGAGAVFGGELASQAEC